MPHASAPPQSSTRCSRGRERPLLSLSFFTLITYSHDFLSSERENNKLSLASWLLRIHLKPQELLSLVNEGPPFLSDGHSGPALSTHHSVSAGAARHQWKIYSVLAPDFRSKDSKRRSKRLSPKLHFSEPAFGVQLRHRSTFTSLGVSMRKFSVKSRKLPFASLLNACSDYSPTLCSEDTESISILTFPGPLILWQAWQVFTQLPLVSNWPPTETPLRCLMGPKNSTGSSSLV